MLEQVDETVGDENDDAPISGEFVHLAEQLVGFLVGQRRIRNLRHHFAVLQNTQLVVRRDAAYLDGVQPPFFENPEDFMLAAFLRHQQHALLRLAEHDLVRSHASFTLRHAVEFEFDSDAAAPAPRRQRRRTSSETSQQRACSASPNKTCSDRAVPATVRADDPSVKASLATCRYRRPTATT